MTKTDLRSILIIGAGVGLLIQPILANNIPGADLHYLTLPVRVGIVLFFALFATLALWVARLLSRWYRSIYQFAQYAAVGTLNSFIDVGIFNLETALYCGGNAVAGTSAAACSIGNLAFALMKAVSFLFATTNSFLWNKYWTFGATEKASASEVGGFYGVALVGWGINVIVATLVKSAAAPTAHVWINIVAPLAGILVSFIWNFVGYKLWVFKGKGKDRNRGAMV